MRILAVIPARAGSKGIPNKNIRLIGGHPLVYYAIRNALESSWITDEIVTTDSSEVAIIASQMGAKVKWRDARLCADDVTLDAVVADAIFPVEGGWDYIVTMQPTSPTLRVSTLDAAIAYAVSHDLDTLISAINAPHLSWAERDGKKVPNYAKRLNRQFLPPCYKETGAFVISRASVVTPKTRIGEKVDIFELPEDEAQDVDTFDDLRSVSSTLEGRRVAMYIAGGKRGMGQTCHALEIADELYEKPDIYYDIRHTGPDAFGQTMHRLIAVDGTEDLFQKCRENGYTLFINDIQSSSTDYMDGLRRALPKARIINFEDYGEGRAQADLVFNTTADDALAAHVYAGERYYISPKPFLFYRPIWIRERVERVFLSFEGEEGQKEAARLLSIVSKPEYRAFQFVAALDGGRLDVLKTYRRFENIRILSGEINRPELMSGCDLGITADEKTAYELAMFGIPTIAITQNRQAERHCFVSSENGFACIGLNSPEEGLEACINQSLRMPRASRQSIQDRLLSHDLRGGRGRVMSIINGCEKRFMGI